MVNSLSSCGAFGPLRYFSLYRIGELVAIVVKFWSSQTIHMLRTLGPQGSLVEYAAICRIVAKPSKLPVLTWLSFLNRGKERLASRLVVSNFNAPNGTKVYDDLG
ncbi:hypothetical protein BpHYR1_030767 [Brachionus plicatilis]|uniref:Uncharacterized protein n=1 Tax=Brachionus plicatilis TaxID=10195 RepID=A0A3M7PVA4_BRAPC|nr:hypothetical protein BpHYR1_030767 [Brachionus plicatilis]